MNNGCRQLHQRLHQQHHHHRRDWVRKLGQTGGGGGGGCGTGSMLSVEFGLAGAAALPPEQTRVEMPHRSGRLAKVNYCLAESATAINSLPRIGGVSSAGPRYLRATAYKQQQQQQKQQQDFARIPVTSTREEPLAMQNHGEPDQQRQSQPGQRLPSATPMPPPQPQLLWVSGSRQTPSTTRERRQQPAQLSVPSRTTHSAAASNRRRHARTAAATVRASSGSQGKAVGPWSRVGPPEADEAVSVLRYLLESMSTCPFAADSSVRQSDEVKSARTELTRPQRQ